MDTLKEEERVVKVLQCLQFHNSLYKITYKRYDDAREEMTSISDDLYHHIY